MGIAATPRLRNQTWSIWSTQMPTTCCMLHWLGSGLGQNGSTRYCGAPFLSTTCFATTWAWPVSLVQSAASAHTMMSPAHDWIFVTRSSALLLSRGFYSAGQKWRYG